MMNISAVGDRRYSGKIEDANMTASLRRRLQASAYTNRLATREQLWPPKPGALLRMASTFDSRAVLGV